MQKKSNKNMVHNQERIQQPTQTQLSRFEKYFRKNYLKMYYCAIVITSVTF